MKAHHLLVLISLCTLAPHASAVGPLATDPNAIPAYRGTFLLTAASVDNLARANVDFAVFAPGAVGPASVPGEYVYAFQVFSDGQATQGFAESFILGSFTHLSGVNASYGLAGGAVPVISRPGSLGSFPSQFDFAANFSPALGSADHSAVFWFSSAQQPNATAAFIQNGTAVGQGFGLAGPIPAPSAAATVFAATLITSRRRRPAQ